MHIIFFSGNKFVLLVDMCMNNFRRQILDWFTDDQKADWFFGRENGYEFRWLFDKELVRKVWNACIQHGYINEYYVKLDCFVDNMRVEKNVEIQV